MATTVGGKYSHLGTFSAINVSNGNVYGMNDSGTAFDDASSLSTVTPFRTYMSPTATRSNARYDYTSVINIAEQNADNIMPDMEENEDDTQTEDHITVRAIGNQRVRIESTMATRLNVVTERVNSTASLTCSPALPHTATSSPGSTSSAPPKSSSDNPVRPGDCTAYTALMNCGNAGCSNCQRMFIGKSPYESR